MKTIEEICSVAYQHQNGHWTLVLKPEYKVDGVSTADCTNDELQEVLQKVERVDDKWVTMRGRHVLIDGNGTIKQGPADLKGKTLKNGKMQGEVIGEKSSDGKTKNMKEKHDTPTGKKNYGALSEKRKNGLGKELFSDKRVKDVGFTNTSDADKDSKGRFDYLGTKKGDLLSEHLDENGKLTKQRERLHRKIVQDHFQGVRKPKEGERREFTFLGGGSASGKSTATKNPDLHFPSNTEAVKIDADAIKNKLPEYKNLTAKGDFNAAGYAHEESSALSKRVMQTALDNGFNGVLDGVGDGNPNSMLKKINQAKKAGCHVKGLYCTVPTKVALERSFKRALKTGREVSAEEIAKNHAGVSRVLKEIASQFDEGALYDTSTKVPVLIATYGNGKGLTAVKGKEKELQAFLDKENDNQAELVAYYNELKRKYNENQKNKK